VFDKLRRMSHSNMAQRELRQSLEHFLSAASHAAKGTGATVGPKMTAARQRIQPTAGKVKGAASSGWGNTAAALAPMAVAATKSRRSAAKAARKVKERNARTQQKSRRPKLATLLVAGAAVGAVSALVLRRRKQHGWDEYDPAAPMATAKPMDADEMLPASLAPEAASGKATMSGTTPGVTDNEQDQTSSPMHSPTVARMAGGNRPN